MYSLHGNPREKPRGFGDGYSSPQQELVPVPTRHNPSNKRGSKKDKTLLPQNHKSLFSREQLDFLKVLFGGLETKMDAIIQKIDEINNGNYAKDIPFTRFFSTLCELKAMDQRHPTASGYGIAFNRFFEYMNEKHSKIKNLNELKPIMVSGYVKWLKNSHKKTGNKKEILADTSINGYIKCLRHALETMDKVGTQELRAHLHTIRRPRRIKKPYIPNDEEMSKIPKVLLSLMNGESEEAKYLAFVGATVWQLCGRTNALSRLRFDMIEENGDNKPFFSYVGKHQVEQVKGMTNDWYRRFFKEWKKYVQKKYDNTQYLFPRRRNGEIDHLTDEQFRMKFKEVMRLCGLPQLNVHSVRYIYATKLYLNDVPPDEIKDILGVDERTLRFYIKEAQERKKKVQFRHLEMVVALPKKNHGEQILPSKRD